MKMTTTQQRAHAVLLASDDGTMNSRDQGKFRTTTMDAMARRGLVKVAKEMTERKVTHRNGTVSTLATVSWTAELTPVTPTAEEIEELDRVVRGRENNLRPDQKLQAAAYVAIISPKVALEGAPSKRPDYSVAAAYARHASLPVDRLLAAYLVVRAMTGETGLPLDPEDAKGDPTNVWSVKEPATATDTHGREVARVVGNTQTLATMAASSLMRRRGYYTLSRLHEKEVEGWVRDFRVGENILRLSANPDGTSPDLFRATDVTSGVLIATGRTVFLAEAAALAEMKTLTT